MLPMNGVLRDYFERLPRNHRAAYLPKWVGKNAVPKAPWLCGLVVHENNRTMTYAIFIRKIRRARGVQGAEFMSWREQNRS